MENESELKLFFWLGTAIMIGLVCLILLLTVIYQKKLHKIKQEEAENLLKISLESEKRERKRISSDLHDSVMGDLNAIRNYLAILDNTEQNSKIHKNPILGEVEIALQTMQENIQGISYNLMPPSLDSSGLVATLENYFERIQKWNNKTIHFQHKPSKISVAENIGYELYRISQELINNMIKYGNVKFIFFYLECDENLLRLTVKDDGIPFDFYESVKNSRGMGLKNIQSRIKQIEAELEQIPIEKGNELVITIKNLS
ncbi:sensor histidine kinase [Mesonia maritima]|uniref:histidine kinase n=2 Tax=Mesonia maritima TaxID=1793873 RepID=A0ABU1K4X0_9FLAO|nr:hypothetical protein [Mesonia maritima]MDR6300660.1 signal transduction histidine kinase [Mesonia maritima]